MTRIHFFELSGHQRIEHPMVAELIEKRYLDKQSISVLCDNEAEALIVDEYLWTFKNTSFIPHNLLSQSLSPPPPVVIITPNEKPPRKTLLINLSHSFPLNPHQYQEIIELITEDEEEKKRLRGFYRQYQQLGLEVSFLKKLMPTEQV